MRNYFYDTMTEVRPGDLVFSFADTLIKAIGLVLRRAEPSVKPDFGAVGGNWSRHGWLVQVEFQELAAPVRPKAHMAQLAPLLPAKYAPLRPNGDGLQGVYLTELPLAFATALLDLVGIHFVPFEADLLAKQETPSSVVENELEGLLGRTDLDATQRRQLVNARAGQGLFRNNVRLNERACRVTGVSQPHHLRASHIKPWRASDDVERLHGCNGLLLAPHVDHLFDRGFISFDDDGQLMISPALEGDVVTAWKLQVPANVGAFNVDQKYFLAYHRGHVLLES
ncbi:MAG: HNH endonuclease [Motilibacteraceae bacterium]